MSSPRDSIDTTISDISTATTVVNSDSNSNPTIPVRRMTTSNASSTSTAQPGRAPVVTRPGARPLDEQCTHITMTRIFTDTYHCSKCMQPPSNGWLWRCSQDRELMLEHDEEVNIMDRIDAVYDIFGKPKKPLKGSPTARKNPISFFDEIDDDQYRTYSIDQIDLILAQRKNVLEVAQRASAGEFRAPSSSQDPQPEHPSLRMYLPRFAARPWLPILGGECQTKYCHHCWPHGLARSYMSINAVVNGDHPREAIHGLSFVLTRERTVSNVKHVANLGLRPNPTKVGIVHSASFIRMHNRLAKLEKISFAKPKQGLGISGTQAESSKSQVVPTSPKKAKPRPLYSRRSATKHPLALKQLPARLTPLSPTNGSFPPEIPYPPSPSLARRHSIDLLPISAVMHIPLPEQTEEEIQAITPTNDTEHIRFTGSPSSSIAAGDGGTPISLHSRSSTATEEFDITDIRPTPVTAMAQEATAMEREEAANGEGTGAFGSEPLQVNGGVALLEESVQNHVPDIMTQC